MRKSLEDYVTEDPEFLPLDPDEFDEASDLVLENYYLAMEEISTLYRSIESIESLVSLKDVMLAKESVSTEDLAIFKEATNLVLAGSDVDSRLVFPSLEKESDPRVAIEGIGSAILEAITRVAKRIQYNLTAQADTSNQLYSILDFQRNRAKQIRTDLELIKKTAGNKKVIIEVPVNTFTAYGKPTVIVANGKEYMQELVKSTTFISGYLTTMGKLINTNFLTSLKVLFSPITGYSEQYRKIYVKIRNMIVGIAKLPGMKQLNNKADRHTAQTDVLLGSYQVSCSYPKEEEFDYSNQPSLKKITKLLGITFDRDEAVDRKLKKTKTLLLEVDVKYIEQLLDMSEKLIKDYRDYNSVSAKLAIFEASVVSVDFFKNVGSVVGLISLILANYRMLLKVSFIITQNSGGAFVVSKGHTKKMLAICEKAVKALA